MAGRPSLPERLQRVAEILLAEEVRIAEEDAVEQLSRAA